MRDDFKKSRATFERIVSLSVSCSLSFSLSRTKKAFTLAEVLIVLGIIGVVAALTIPTLMKNYQKKVLNIQFKKAYSTLTQALNYARVDYDYMPICYYKASGIGSLKSSGNALGTDCSKYMSNFYGALKVSKYCANKAFEQGCIPEYEGKDTIAGAQYPDTAVPEGYNSVGEYLSRGCPYYRKNYILNNNSAYVIQNGMIIVPYGTGPLFAVDINGSQGPNKWGYDLFSFRILFDGNSIYLGADEGCMSVENGGRSTLTMITNVMRK